MKKTLLSLFCMAILVITLHAQNVSIPDANFRNALIEYGIDTNNDSIIQVSEAQAVSHLSIDGSNITDLKGIEEFTALTSFACNGSQVSSIDLSKNTLLTNLTFTGSLLTSLDLSKNVALTYVDCSNNPSLGSIAVTVNQDKTSWVKDATTLYNYNVGSFVISDPVFKASLIDYGIDTNNDNCIQKEEAQVVTYLGDSIEDYLHHVPNIYNGVIGTDLTGIQEFTALRILVVHNDWMTYGSNLTLDVSKNIHLTQLTLRGFNLTSLDISKNTALEYLNIDFSPVQDSLDLSKNTLLKRVQLQGSNLATLDVSHNPLLLWLDLSGSRVSSLDFTHNKDLFWLYCPDNKLTSLDVTQNPHLTTLACENNPDLEQICVNARLFMNINGVHPMGVFPNPPTTPEYGYMYSKDEAATWDLSCFDAQHDGVHIPDGFFKAALILTHGVDTNHDEIIQFSEAEAVTGLGFMFSCDMLSAYPCDAGNPICTNCSDFTGIEAFTALERFNCGETLIDTLDLSKNTALTWLDYSFSSQLTSIDITKNSALTHLYGNNNPLTTIDVSHNTALKNFDCVNNLFTSLDVSKNSALTQLSCERNLLTSLDVSNNLALTSLYCNENPSLSEICVNENQLALTPNWSKDDAATWTNCLATSINDAKPINPDVKITVYPNPAQQNITVLVNGIYTIQNINIINTIGQTVMSKQISNNHVTQLIDVSALKNGIYFISIKTDNGVVIKKFIKE